MNSKAKSTFFLFTAAIVWGFAFVAQKLGADDVAPFYFNGIRFVIGAIALIPVVLISERGNVKQKLVSTIRAAALCAMFLFIASALQQRGIMMTNDAGKSGFITALYSVLVPVFYFLIFRRKTSFNIWVGAVLAIVGTFFLSVKNDFTVETGDLVLLLGSVFWAGHIISIDFLIKDLNPVKFSLFQALFAGIYNLAFAVFTETITFSGFNAALIPILYCGVCSTGIAYTCQIVGQKGADPTIATIILSTESLFSVLGGALIDGETMSPRGYLGCLLIFAGVVVSQIVIKAGKNKNKIKKESEQNV